MSAVNAVYETIQNVTGNIAGHLNNAANRVVNNIEDMVEGARRGIYGQNRPEQNYQQQNYQNGNGYNGPMQPNTNMNGFAPPTVNGVVNLNGVNGHNGHTSYNGNTNGDHQSGYVPNGLVNNGNSGPNGFVNAYSTNTDRSNSAEGHSNMPGYSQNGGQQEHNGQYGNQAYKPDQRDLHTVPYTNGNGFAAPQGYGRPPYVDLNGMNPPAGYVPQAETSVQASILFSFSFYYLEGTQRHTPHQNSSAIVAEEKEKKFLECSKIRASLCYGVKKFERQVAR
ncbi:hypothetical protein TELCIR_15786 [Teladorsagia circumcincta]|uniref:Uncharacterized protein n=1 Tax=Teladorsagia circumcincta TaxID=45464 RepID=A0A2G9TXB0_TELCI|nr:hypothetical protein TELCIR_15786 [Teladorsagia circumcincta]